MNTPTPPAVAPRRPPVAHLLGGLLLIVVCVLLSLQVYGRIDDRTPALAAVRDVAAGQQLTAADLRQVMVGADDGLLLIPAADLDKVVGRAAAVPLRAGQLIAAPQLGPSDWPPADKALIAVGVDEGHLPAGVVPGAQISVITPESAPGTAAPSTKTPGSLASASSPTAAPAGTGTAAVQVRGTVVAVTASSEKAGSVVTVLVPAADALLLGVPRSTDVAIIVWGAP
ncbi:SAF domain-containing protein [Catellatospora sp. KI3]|uniref:SAF domain-containing protein n=1 Tax=Catellatospora sp. KI3 TaxID=3041620 RepID=UPI00248317AF|nr:SAF domain-containing protein [Catellatospora sp. KI3]MDI1461034.1 SAF domain-containing protein [Catellatospora sp. KI3]